MKNLVLFFVCSSFFLSFAQEKKIEKKFISHVSSNELWKSAVIFTNTSVKIVNFNFKVYNSSGDRIGFEGVLQWGTGMKTNLSNPSEDQVDFSLEGKEMVVFFFEEFDGEYTPSAQIIVSGSNLKKLDVSFIFNRYDYNSKVNKWHKSASVGDSASSETYRDFSISYNMDFDSYYNADNPMDGGFVIFNPNSSGCNCGVTIYDGSGRNVATDNFSVSPNGKKIDMVSSFLDSLGVEIPDVVHLEFNCNKEIVAFGLVFDGAVTGGVSVYPLE